MGNPLAGWKANVYVSGGASTPQVNGSMTDGGAHTVFTVGTPSQRYWDPAPAVAPIVQVEVDEIQTVTITGAPTGGTFTLTFGGNTTATINWNDNAATVQTRLQALASIGASNCTVTGGPGPGTPFTVEFVAAKGFASQALITLSNNLLTGGTSPSVSITRAQAGSTWTTQAASLYTIQFCGGIVTFLAAVALSAGCACRVSYNWFAVSQALQAKSVEVQTQVNILDDTSFASAQANGGWKTKIVDVGEATWKLSQWHLDNFFLTLLNTLMVVAAYSGANANQRLEGYGLMKQDSIKFALGAVNEESIEIEASGPIFAILS